MEALPQKSFSHKKAQKAQNQQNLFELFVPFGAKGL
jgi:hypothetical protein